MRPHDLDFLGLRLTSRSCASTRRVTQSARHRAWRCDAGHGQGFWKRIREAGFIDFANIIYYSFLLLQKHASILRYISARFAWILVTSFRTRPTSRWRF